MLFHELLHQVTWNEVKNRLVALYPEQMHNLPGYEQVFTELLTLSPREGKSSTSILVRFFDDRYDVAGMNDSGNNEGSFIALDFCDWDEWLGFSVHEETLKLGPADIVAHCLHELTWNGFTQDRIREKKQQLVEAYTKALSTNSACAKPIKKRIVIEYDLAERELRIVDNEFSTFESLGVLEAAKQIISADWLFDQEDPEGEK